MSLTETQRRVLDQSVSIWFANHGGASADSIAETLSLTHEEVMKAVEELAELKQGSLNRNVSLFSISFDPASPSSGFTETPITTHIFFPAGNVLRRAFYTSELPAQNLPEYICRLHLGTPQIGLIFFSEEVLARYFDHPELYDINDSLAGGEISSRGQDVDDRYLYVRYGKCRLQDGKIAVTAICKDLADMGVSEQRHWHSHEIVNPALDYRDSNFQTFLSRTYEGAWVEYPDPIAELINAMQSANALLSLGPIFTRLENIHLRAPVEQTYKAFCDCASELFKLIGPDGLSQSTMKALLQQIFLLSASDFIHQESKRPFSTLQLLSLLEQNLKLSGNLSAVIGKISKLRIEADHKILDRDERQSTYSDQFSELCKETGIAVNELTEALASMGE